MVLRASSQDRQTKPLFLVMAVGFVCLAALSAGRELYRREQVKQELATLEDRVAQLEDRKTQVSQLLEQLQTPEVLDREARLRLNMQRPGERVYVLKGEEWERLAAKPSQDVPTLYDEHAAEPERSNPERWFRYFFVHEGSG